MVVQDITLESVVRRMWDIYRDQAGVLLGTAAVLFAIQFLIYLLLPGLVGILTALLFWVLSTLYQGMVVKLVQDVQDGRRDHSVSELLQSVEPVLLPLMAVSVIFGVCVGIGFVLLIVPGLILLTIWAVVGPVMVLEHPGVFATFGRSRQLVRGSGWNVFGVIVVLYLAVVVVSVGAGLISDGLGAFGRSVIQWAWNVALAPVEALTASVLYFALRSKQPEPGGAGPGSGPPPPGPSQSPGPSAPPAPESSRSQSPGPSTPPAPESSPSQSPGPSPPPATSTPSAPEPPAPESPAPQPPQDSPRQSSLWGSESPAPAQPPPESPRPESPRPESPPPESPRPESPPPESPASEAPTSESPTASPQPSESPPSESPPSETPPSESPGESTPPEPPPN